MSEDVKKGTRRGESSKKSNMFAGIAAARMSPNKQVEHVEVEENNKELIQPEQIEQQVEIDSNPDAKKETVENINPVTIEEPVVTNTEPESGSLDKNIEINKTKEQSIEDTQKQKTVEMAVVKPAKEAVIKQAEQEVDNQKDIIKEITKKVESVYRERKKEKKKQDKSAAAYQTSIRIDKDLWDFIQSIVEESEDGAALSSNMVINCLIAMNKNQ